MTRNPIKKSRSSREILNLSNEIYSDRNLAELGGRSIRDRQFQNVEDIYVKTPKTNDTHPFETHVNPKKRTQVREPESFGEVLKIGRENQRKLKNERIRSQMRDIPLTSAEKRWWDKIFVLKSFIKRDLQDFRNVYKQTALKKLYQLILHQEHTREYDFRELYAHLSREYKSLFKDRLRG